MRNYELRVRGIVTAVLPDAITREIDIDAPPEVVWSIVTEARHLAGWFSDEVEIDLRPGGQFKFVSKSHPEMPFAGTYSEISPPDRLIFEAMGATGRVVLKDAAGKTHMTVEIACRSAADLDQYLKMGVDVGTGR